MIAHPFRPHLVRAYYDWMVENELAPHIVVNADVAGVKVPTQYIQDGKINLNIAQDAILNLVISNDDMTFNARFAGVAYQLYIPMAALIAIYTVGGIGFEFQPEPQYDLNKVELTTVADNVATKKSLEKLSTDKPKRPKLTVIK